ncbi:MAG: threonine--tRNA ligase [Candidatus Yanofskybacteria bacterium]|nr:threonine--tRNA ligase [Candidatus Yanofskybacteria bacterium]
MKQSQNGENLEHVRHSFAHVLAAAVKQLHPEVQLGIGPVIENGFYYDFGNIQLSSEDLPKVEKAMRKIAEQKLAFKKELWSISEALEHFKKENQPYKLELIEELEKTEKEVGMVWMGDVFLDLCRGGHIESTSELPLDAFKLTKVAGAYWRGDEKRPMLTRVYGIAFETAEELQEYLKRQEEAEKRDHKKLGKALGLFVFSDLVGPGLPLFTPKGTWILNQIKEYSRELRAGMGYQLVQTPQVNKAELFKISGHYDKYQDSMFRVRSNYTEEEYFLKPMNCPQHTQLYASESRSYRDLPVRFADFSLLYRDEKPGELGGLVRLRSFSQDDGHCFCAEDQIEDEFNRVLDAISLAMKRYEMNYWIRLSLRNEDAKENYLGDDATWEKAQQTMRGLLQKRGVEFKEAPGEAAFYGPKMDLVATDSIGREWQLSTIQLDLNMPKRFGLVYAAADGNKQSPVMIHSAIVGSPERFLGVLIEHYAGAFPLWLSPEQVWIVPVSDKFNEYAQQVAAQLQEKQFRVSLRGENETLGKKIRAGEKEKIPYLLVVGDKEAQANSVSARKRGEGDLGSMPVAQLLERLQSELSPLA